MPQIRSPVHLLRRRPAGRYLAGPRRRVERRAERGVPARFSCLLAFLCLTIAQGDVVPVVALERELDRARVLLVVLHPHGVPYSRHQEVRYPDLLFHSGPVRRRRRGADLNHEPPRRRPEYRLLISR